jgi:hypothetical protein
MPLLDQSYLDTARVRNTTSGPISIGDLNITILQGETVNLLKQATKDNLNQSRDLQTAIGLGWLILFRTKRQTRPRDQRKASLAWEEDILDLNLSGLSDDDLLQYDGSTEKWVNVQPEDKEGPDKNVITVINDYIIVSLDDLILVDASSRNVTISVPSAVSNPGKEFDIKKIDSTRNEVIVDAYNLETIDGELTQIIDYQYDCMDIVSTSLNWVIV